MIIDFKAASMLFLIVYLFAQQYFILMLKDLFKKLDLDDKEYLVFTTLYKLGTNAASIIAARAGLERTTTYRILKKLTQLGLVSTTTRAGIQVFDVENEKSLLKFIQRKKQQLESLEDNYQLVENELINLRPENLNPPKIKIYDHPANVMGGKIIFNDIFDEVKRQNLKTIRLLATDTFTEEMGTHRLKDMAELFFKDLQKDKIKVDAMVAEGMLTRERLVPTENLTDLAKLPASNGAVNIYIVGDTVFILLFRENTLGLQISHPDIAQTLHFLFDQAQGKN